MVNTLVSDNGSQFMSGEFRDFCETYQIEHITISPYHPRSNEQAERFVDTLKRALQKARATPIEKALQQFLQIYRITSNNKTPASQFSAKVMFAHWIWSIYNKVLPKQMKLGRTCIVLPKRYNSREFQRIFKDNKSFWEMGTIEERVGNIIYIIKGPQFTHKRHLNQFRKHLTDSGLPEETVIDVTYNTFNILTLLVVLF